jgi:SAM-dependent methyltransferase
MSSSNLIRLGGLAAIIAGVLRGVASFVPQSVAIDQLELLYLFTDLFILFGIMGLYGFQHEEAGILGVLGFLLAIAGSGMIIGPDGELFGVNLYPVGALILAVGLDLLVIGSWLAHKLPRWTLVSLGLSTVLGFVGYFVPSLGFLFVVSGVLFAIGFAGAGSQVWWANSDRSHKGMMMNRLIFGMMMSRLIAGKFRNPTGFLGRLVGNMMTRRNEPAINWTILLLNIQQNEHILEIGFGPGVGIESASQKAIKGFVAGIDASETMVQVAHQRNAAAIASGQVNLQQGKVSDLPYEDDSFDKAMTIHCIYFWANAIACLQEIRRILKPNGILAVTILPKDTWLKQGTPPPDLFTLYNSNEVVQLLADSGFREVQVKDCPSTTKFSGVCVLGVK